METHERKPINSNDAFDALVSKPLKKDLDEKVVVRKWTLKDLRDVRNGAVGSLVATLILALVTVAIVFCQNFVNRAEETQKPQNAPIEKPYQEGPVPTVRKPEKDSWHVIDI